MLIPLGRVTVATVVLATALAACSSSSSSSAASSKKSTGNTPTTAPKGLPAFYAVPTTAPADQPGRLVKSEKVAAKGLHGTVYRVLYVSHDVHNKPVYVTGLVIVPDKAAPDGGYPIVTWGHGTNGMTNQCAPSLAPTTAVPLTNQLLDQGWEVTASDYQGEGTPPGLLPYIVGDSAAYNTIDIVRAARHLATAHASAAYVGWGHSEGGQTAMFVLKDGPSYAPDLQLKGVVAGAPPSQLGLIYDFLKTSPYRYYLLMAAGGFNVAYGNQAAPLASILTKKGIALLADLKKGCADYLGKVAKSYTTSEVSKGNPFDVPAWKTLLTENDPNSFATASPSPLLIIHGGKDQEIPTVSSQLLAQHLCGVGQGLERWVYPGQSHSGVIAPSAGDMIQWMRDRFTDGPNPDPYQPTGQADITVTRCPG